MRIISGTAKNFGSYKELKFNFNEQGLALIQGATGSGKSTLCDLVPWVLYGKTAKGGAADEVISWGNKDMTKAVITIELGLKRTMEVTRVRAKGKNDLYFSLYDKSIYNRGEVIPNPRGKDLADTQKLINSLIGIDYDTYMSGAYFHEFSKTAAFFISSAKERRAICEQIVDLTLPKKIQAELVIKKKDAKKEVEAAQGKLVRSQIALDFLTDTIYRLSAYETLYINERSQKIRDYKKLRDTFEETQSKTLIGLHKDIQDIEIAIGKNKANIDYQVIAYNERKIKELQHKQDKAGICPTCGGPVDHSKNNDLQKLILKYNLDKQQMATEAKELSQLTKELGLVKATILFETNRDNTYHTMIADLKLEKNPYTEQLDMETISLAKVVAEETLLSDKLAAAKSHLADLELLSEVTDTLRSRTIINTIDQVQDNTNKLLSTHFDAELTVNFEVVDADKLEVSIYKDANLCVYTQLSKGQRQLLKLCFGLSIMKAVSNNNAVKFNSIFLDESLDGLDDNLKIKSYTLLQTLALEYGSVFIVEHNEALKSLFPNRFIVTNTNGESTIEKS